MTIFKSVLLVALGLTGQALYAASAPSKHAPSELSHFAPMIGQWSTQEESLKPDGTGWAPAKGADWTFDWAYDGFGIIDYYVSPAAHIKLKDEATRQRGINLRTYNVKEKKWVMTWLTAAAVPPNGFTAVSTDERIVMLGDQPGPGGFYSRITFFEMKANSFEWTLERSKDQTRWREVYRIHGTRKEP